MFGGAHIGLSTPIKMYSCPDDDRLLRAHLTPYGNYFVALTSYLGVNGTDYPAKDGVYYYGSQTKLTDISDGTSTTLAAGERPPGADYNHGWWYISPAASVSGGFSLLGTRDYRAPNDKFTPGCSTGPYHYVDDTLENPCQVYHFWSLHSGGANFAFADGSVRLLSYSADSVLPALATRVGGEIVDWE